MKITTVLRSSLILVVSAFIAVHDVAVHAADDRAAVAESLFMGRCQMCHQLPEPDMLKLKQWKLILSTMQQRMQQAGVPPLTEQETEMLLEYLSPRARQ